MLRQGLSLAARPARGPQDAISGPVLSGREQEVLCLLRHGLSCPGIGRELGITPRTVRAHLAAIKGKLGAATAAHCVARGFDQGLLVAGQARRSGRGTCH